jgi:hypothetical protein
MKKKTSITLHSKPKPTKRRNRINPKLSKNQLQQVRDSIFGGIFDFIKQITSTNKHVDIPNPFESYELARDFTKEFIDYQCSVMNVTLSDFDRQRMKNARQEIMCEVLRDKYNFPLDHAATLLLQLGIESLVVADEASKPEDHN